MVADLNVESFASAYEKFMALAAAQLQKRKDALAAFVRKAPRPTSTPVHLLFCLQSFGKFPGTDGLPD